MKVKVRRLVVVDDNFESHGMDRYPMDTDAVWFEEEDYRESIQSSGNGNFLYRYKDIGNNAISFENVANLLPGFDEPMTLNARKSDSLNAIGEGMVDFGLSHEFGVHLSTDCMDTYTIDVNKDKVMLFRFNTGYGHIPIADPYMVMIMNENIKRKIRGYYSDPKGIGRGDGGQDGLYIYGLVPKKVDFVLEGFNNFSLTESWFEKDNGDAPDYYHDKYFVETSLVNTTKNGLVLDDAEVSLGKIKMEGGKELYPLVYKLSCADDDGNECDLYFPRALLNMAYMSGSVEKVVFDIKMVSVVGQGLSQNKVQTLEFVKKEKIDDYMTVKSQKLIPVLARMDLPGTDLVCVWSYVAE